MCVRSEVRAIRQRFLADDILWLDFALRDVLEKADYAPIFIDIRVTCWNVFEYERARDNLIEGLLSEEDAWGILPRLREERKPLEQEIAALAAPANVVTLHPGAVKRYLEAV